MDKLNSLTKEQQEKVEQFQSVTEIEDLNTSISTLDAYDWNLERAVTSFFDAPSPSEKDEAGPSTSAYAGQSRSVREEVESTTNGGGPSTPPLLPRTLNIARPVPGRLGFFSFITWPFTFSFNMLWTLITYGFRLLSRQSIAGPSSQPPRTERDPATLAQRFLIEFEESYGRTHPAFHQGGYSSALNLAKRDGRFLLAILLSSEHDSTHDFCATTLQNPELLTYLDQQQILVWGGNVRESEAFQVSTTLQATTYPFLALITLTTPVRSSGSTAPKMSVVDRIEGLSTPAEIQRRVQLSLDRHGSVIATVRREREERNLARRIRDEQDAAYRESLRQDREKERRIRISREADEQAERERLAKEERQRKLARDRVIYRRWLAFHLPLEPVASQQDVARLSFRLGDGQRVVRTFGPNATVDSVYAFIDCYPFLNSSSSSSSLSSPSPSSSLPSSDVESPSESYVHSYDFQIVSPYPRTVFPPSNKLLREDTRLWPGTSLVVESLDEADD